MTEMALRSNHTWETNNFVGSGYGLGSSYPNPTQTQKTQFFWVPKPNPNPKTQYFWVPKPKPNPKTRFFWVPKIIFSNFFFQKNYFFDSSKFFKQNKHEKNFFHFVPSFQVDF